MRAAGKVKPGPGPPDAVGGGGTPAASSHDQRDAGVDSLFHEGLDHHDLGELDRAIDCYRRVIDLDPKHMGARNSLGMALIEKEMLPEAVAILEKTLEIDPDLADAYNNLGYAYRRMGEEPRAAASYGRYLELVPDSEDAPAIREWVEKAKAGAEAGETRRAHKPGHDAGRAETGVRNPGAGKALEGLSSRSPTVTTIFARTPGANAGVPRAGAAPRAARNASENAFGQTPGEGSPGARASRPTPAPGRFGEGALRSEPLFVADGLSAPKLSPTDFDLKFAGLLRQNQIATQSQINDGLETIKRIAALGARKALPDLLVERGVVTENQALAVAHAVRSGDGGGIVGGFQILEKIGEGGMGEVYKARQISLDRLVALKILPKRLASTPGFVARFEREAKSAAKLSHPNIVGAVDVGKASGSYYFAMEFIDGESLQEVLKEEGRLPEAAALDIIIQITRGLDYAWRNSMVHRDVKPDNIMLTRDGVAKLADLGLARAAGNAQIARLTQTGSVVGSPHFISPEQAYDEPQLDIRTDIYSLGITFYYMVTGVLPFEGGDTMAIIQARFQGPLPPANQIEPEVSPGVAQVINVMTALQRDERYPDPRVLLHDLMLLEEGRKPEFASPDKAARARAVEAARTMKTITSIRPPRRSRLRSRLVAALVAAGVFSVLGVFAVFGAGFRAADVTLSRAGIEAAREAADEVKRAKRADLTAEAKRRYEAVLSKVKAERHEDALAEIASLGSKYQETSYHAKFEALKLDAARRADEARRLAAKRAETERRYAVLIGLARDEIAVRDYAGAVTLLVQAGALKETDEVRELRKAARLAQHVSRAKEAEARGDFGTAIKFYELALNIRDDEKFKEEAAKLKRKALLADRTATGDRLAGEGRWVEARGAYGQALAVAINGERGEVERKARAADLEIRYADELGRTREAVAKKAWKSVILHAEAALAAKPGDRDAGSLIELAKAALGPERVITNSIGMRFVLVPAGGFLMGSDTEDEDERPVRTVRLDAYYIGETEVTNSQFERHRPGHRGNWKQYSPGDDMPVIAVTWEEATAFCRWLSRKEGVEYRLPTEAEWERAARGTDGRTYPWGNESPNAGGTYRCNFAPGTTPGSRRRDGFELAAPVGSFPGGASPSGCLDMAGNVWEWCHDWYAPDYYASAASENPAGPPSGTKRVLRGGSLTDGPGVLRCANRLGKSPTFFEANVGFRCVRAVRLRTVSGPGNPSSGSEGTGKAPRAAGTRSE